MYFVKKWNQEEEEAIDFPCSRKKLASNLII